MPIETLIKRSNSEVVKFESMMCVHYTAPFDRADVVADLAPQQGLIDHYGHLSVIVIIHSDTVGRPNTEARDYASEKTQQLANHLVCSALVVLGQGIAAATMRIALIAFNLMSKAGARQKIFSDVPTAVAWVRTFPGQWPEIDGLDEVTLMNHLGLNSEMGKTG